MSLWEPSEPVIRFIENYKSGIVLISVVKGLPPSANHAWIHARRGGVRIRSKEYLQYINATRQKLRGSCLNSVQQSPIAICIGLHSPRFITKKNKVSKTMDIDNRIKTLLDMLHGGGRSDKGGIIPVDDSFYWHIEAHKIPSSLEYTEIVVANIPDKLGYKL